MGKTGNILLGALIGAAGIGLTVKGGSKIVGAFRPVEVETENDENGTEEETEGE